MILAEAVRVVQHHQSMLAANDPDYREEYFAGLADDNNLDSGVRLAEALGVILKGEVKYEQGIRKAG